jgi:hypothetical protein
MPATYSIRTAKTMVPMTADRAIRTSLCFVSHLTTFCTTFTSLRTIGTSLKPMLAAKSVALALAASILPPKVLAAALAEPLK